MYVPSIVINFGFNILNGNFECLSFWELDFKLSPTLQRQEKPLQPSEPPSGHTISDD